MGLMAASSKERSKQGSCAGPPEGPLSELAACCRFRGQSRAVLNQAWINFQSIQHCDEGPRLSHMQQDEPRIADMLPCAAHLLPTGAAAQACLRGMQNTPQSTFECGSAQPCRCWGGLHVMSCMSI